MSPTRTMRILLTFAPLSLWLVCASGAQAQSTDDEMPEEITELTSGAVWDDDYGFYLPVRNTTVCAYNMPNGRPQYVVLPEGSSCDPAPERPHIFIRLSYDMTAYNEELPPRWRVIARHDCGADDPTRRREFGPAPVRVGGLPTFICRHSYDLSDGTKFYQTALLAYRGPGPFPKFHYFLWTKAPVDEIEQAERDLFAVARRIQLRPYDR